MRLGCVRRRAALRSLADRAAERQLVRFSGSGFVRISRSRWGRYPSCNTSTHQLARLERRREPVGLPDGFELKGFREDFREELTGIGHRASEQVLPPAHARMDPRFDGRPVVLDPVQSLRLGDGSDQLFPFLLPRDHRRDELLRGDASLNKSRQALDLRLDKGTKKR